MLACFSDVGVCLGFTESRISSTSFQAATFNQLLSYVAEPVFAFYLLAPGIYADVPAHSRESVRGGL